MREVHAVDAGILVQIVRRGISVCSVGSRTVLICRVADATGCQLMGVRVRHRIGDVVGGARKIVRQREQIICRVEGAIIVRPILGGLHHRYGRQFLPVAICRAGYQHGDIPEIQAEACFFTRQPLIRVLSWMQHEWLN